MKFKVFLLGILLMLGLYGCKVKPTAYRYTIFTDDVYIDSDNENTEAIQPFNTVLFLDVYSFDQNLDLDAEAKEYNELVAHYHRLFDRHNEYYHKHATVNNLKRINDIYGTATELEIEAPLFDILNISLELGELTGGYFNIGVGTSAQMWSNVIARAGANLLRNLPSQEQIAAANSCTPTITQLRQILKLEERDGKYFVSFDSLNSCQGNINYDGLELNKVSLTLGAIGKGYAVDKILMQMRQKPKTKNIAVYAGGSSFASSSNYLGGDYWTLALEDAISEGLTSVCDIKITGEFAVSTSGIYERGFLLFDENNNIQDAYHHIVNPFTGRPELYHAAITLLGDSATFLDAITTALISMDFNDGLDLIERLEGETVGEMNIGKLKVIYQTELKFDQKEIRTNIHFNGFAKKEYQVNWNSKFNKYHEFYDGSSKLSNNYFTDHFWPLFFPFIIVFVILSAGLIYGYHRRKRAKHESED